jgi:N-acetylglutamate synthase-like GNAT family acetyltransferase
MFFLRRAKEEDRNWLNTCNLGFSGEKIEHMDHYYMLESAIEQKPIGMLAIELYEDVAYLHSLRFAGAAPSVDQLGLLFDHLVLYCQKQGKAQLCMVVPPTSEWLLELGFSPLEEAPNSMKQSAHYQRVSAEGRLLSYSLRK